MFGMKNWMAQLAVLDKEQNNLKHNSNLRQLIMKVDSDRIINYPYQGD
jgi:hypothetical protein